MQLQVQISLWAARNLFWKLITFWYWFRCDCLSIKFSRRGDADMIFYGQKQTLNRS